jgi:hypothetical protein
MACDAVEPQVIDKSGSRPGDCADVKTCKILGLSIDACAAPAGVIDCNRTRHPVASAIAGLCEIVGAGKNIDCDRIAGFSALRRQGSVSCA